MRNPSDYGFDAEMIEAFAKISRGFKALGKVKRFRVVGHGHDPNPWPHECVRCHMLMEGKPQRYYDLSITWDYRDVGVSTRLWACMNRVECDFRRAVLT